MTIVNADTHLYLDVERAQADAGLARARFEIDTFSGERDVQINAIGDVAGCSLRLTGSKAAMAGWAADLMAFIQINMPDAPDR